ncbi:MAG: N-acetyltransferase family protein [Bacteroidales bacterium]|nr:N-acetyltransferase family protein [Bacteroidales bacterium]
MIRNVHLEDAPDIARIYNYYIDHTVITFEEENVSASEIDNRIRKITSKNFPFLVYEKNNQIQGYAYVDNWRTRSAYDITLETSIYIDKDYLGCGIGKKLYKELIRLSKTINIHSLIGVISLPNDSSRGLHENLGFQLVGNFSECGKKFNRLIDVEFWQLKLK